MDGLEGLSKIEGKPRKDWGEAEAEGDLWSITRSKWKLRRRRWARTILESGAGGEGKVELRSKLMDSPATLIP